MLRDKKHIEVDVLYQDGVPPRSCRVSGERFRDAFGCNPPRGIAQAVLSMWQRFEQGITTDFGNPEYYNIAWLKLLTAMHERIKRMGNVLPVKRQAEIRTVA